MSLCEYLSVRLCVFTWQKIDQAGGPETLKTLFGLKYQQCFNFYTVFTQYLAFRW